MAGDLHERAAALVAEVCAEHGETTVLRRRTEAPLADHEMEWRSSPSISSDFEVSALWTEYGVKQIDGELILEGDQLVTLPGLDGADPVPLRDVLIRYSGNGDQTWLIVRSRPIRRGETTVSFELQARRPAVES